MSTIISSLLVTHDNRIQELFQKYSRRPYKPNNCACIKLSFQHNTVVQIVQLYNGISPEKIKLYDSMKQERENSDNTIYDFYIVRHGQGLHNTSNIANKLFSIDPELTDVGIQQATMCGRFLKDYFQKNSIGISHYFVSILNRTHLTMFYILQQLLPDEIKRRGITVVVLPNSEEFSKYALPTKLNVSKCIHANEIEHTGNCATQSFMTKDWRYIENKEKYVGMNFIQTAISIINSVATVTQSDNNFDTSIQSTLPSTSDAGTRDENDVLGGKIRKHGKKKRSTQKTPNMKRKKRSIKIKRKYI
jgi:bisphosphoglycerate-dependent phosphoglycerate mutase